MNEARQRLNPEESAATLRDLIRGATPPPLAEAVPNGALDTGSIAGSTWYHVFLIGNATPRPQSTCSYRCP